MLDYDVAQFPPSKLTQKVVTAMFTLKRKFLNNPKSYQIFGLFCKKICYQDLSKIAQSGHTDQRPLYSMTDIQYIIPPFLMHLSTKSIFSALNKWFYFDIIEK